MLKKPHTGEQGIRHQPAKRQKKSLTDHIHPYKRARGVMPIYPEIVDNKYVILRGEGLVIGAEILEANALLYTQPEYKNVAQYQLWDLTALSTLKMSGPEHQVASQQDKEALRLYSHMYVAIAGTTDQVYGVSRMYAGYVPDGVSNIVFRSRDEAEAWLLTQIE